VGRKLILRCVSIVAQGVSQLILRFLSVFFINWDILPIFEKYIFLVTLLVILLIVNSLHLAPFPFASALTLLFLKPILGVELRVPRRR